MSRVRTIPKTKGKKKKKRKRIIESDNQSENDEEYELKIDQLQEVHNRLMCEMFNVNKQEDLGNSMGENNVEMKDKGEVQEAAESTEITIPQITQPQEEMVPIQKIKKVSRLYLVDRDLPRSIIDRLLTVLIREYVFSSNVLF